MRRSQGIALVLCPLVLAVVASAVHANSQRPNIIFFLVDDYDKPETSVYGGDVLTPNLDRMAREGMTLTNAHMTSTVCTPSRYTCLTGRYAGASTCEYYLRENPLGQQGAPAFNVELEPDNMNVGQVLKDNGYATLKNRGTEVPCLIRWPAAIKPGSRCDELIQNTDFVATWFDVAKAKVPDGYRLDGISLSPLFENPNKPIRDYVYGEMGPARSIKTKQWNYIALRYTQEQIDAIRNEHRSVKQLMGLSGGVSRAKAYPHAFDADQLYDLVNDPSEQKNVAAKQGYSKRLEEMKRLLERELVKFPDRPFGEFIPGGNAVGLEGQSELIPKLRKFAAAKK